MVVVGVSALTFVLTYGVPADPAQMVAGPQASVETVRRIHRELELDRPLPVQFGIHLRALLTGNLGESLVPAASGGAAPATGLLSV